jgi:hypothetical protein
MPILVNNQQVRLAEPSDQDKVEVRGAATAILLTSLNGTDRGVLYLRSAALAANTAVTGVILGTPIMSALAAGSSVLSNTIASGDWAVVANRGGNSESYIEIDSSAGEMSLVSRGAGRLMLQGGAGGSVVFNPSTVDVDVLFHGDTINNILVIDGGVGSIIINGTTPRGDAPSLTIQATSGISDRFIMESSDQAAGTGQTLTFILQGTDGITTSVRAIEFNKGGVSWSGVAATRDMDILFRSILDNVVVTYLQYDGSADAVLLPRARLDINGVTYSWPSAQGSAGQQLQTNGATPGVLSWAAAGSLAEWKDIIRTWPDPEEALRRIVGTPVYDFRYRPDGKVTTQDFETLYTGVMAPDAPWAMHHEHIVNPVNTLGYMVLGFQAVSALYDANDKRLQALEARLFA